VNKCGICGHTESEHDSKIRHSFVTESDVAEAFRRILQHIGPPRDGKFDSNAYYGETFPPTVAPSRVRAADTPDCGTCKFYDANGCLCRKRAPTSGWPVVNSGRDWCGDWERGKR
jgi:hypothetical protein